MIKQANESSDRYARESGFFKQSSLVFRHQLKKLQRETFALSLTNKNSIRLGSNKNTTNEMQYTGKNSYLGAGLSLMRIGKDRDQLIMAASSQPPTDSGDVRVTNKLFPVDSEVSSFSEIIENEEFQQSLLAAIENYNVKNKIESEKELTDFVKTRIENKLLENNFLDFDKKLKEWESAFIESRRDEQSEIRILDDNFTQIIQTFSNYYNLPNADIDKLRQLFAKSFNEQYKEVAYSIYTNQSSKILDFYIPDSKSDVSPTPFIETKQQVLTSLYQDYQIQQNSFDLSTEPVLEAISNPNDVSKTERDLINSAIKETIAQCQHNEVGELKNILSWNTTLIQDAKNESDFIQAFKKVPSFREKLKFAIIQERIYYKFYVQSLKTLLNRTQKYSDFSIGLSKIGVQDNILSNDNETKKIKATQQNILAIASNLHVFNPGIKSNLGVQQIILETELKSLYEYASKRCPELKTILLYDYRNQKEKLENNCTIEDLILLTKRLY